MKKKIFGKIAALSLAGLTAVPALSLVSSADVTYSVIESGETTTRNASGTYWEVTETFYKANGELDDTRDPIVIRFDNKSDADAYKGSDGKLSRTERSLTYLTAVGGKIYRVGNKLYTKDEAPANAIEYIVSSGGSTGTSTGSGTVNSSYRYATGYSYKGVNGYWYPNMQALRSETSYSNEYQTLTSGTSWNRTTRPYFSYIYGVYYAEPVEGSYLVTYSSNDGYYGYGTVPAGYRYSDTVSYYSYEMGQYYPNLAALRAAVGYNTTNYTTHTLSRSYSSTYCYFDTSDGEYKASSGSGRVLVNAGNSTSTSSTGYYYYSTYTGRYYTTYAEALSASLNNASYVVYVGNGYYGGYNSYDPYYYYYLSSLYNNGNNSNTSSSTTSSTGTVSITSSTSWNTLANRIKLTGSGKTINVKMNDETTVPSSVLSALKGKNVTLSLKLGNGAVFTINGQDVTSARDINISTKYNTDRIPSTLVKKAYQKFNAVSTAQISVNSNSFGAKVDITVKFAAKRSGCTARLYRYNPDKRSLSLIDTSTVESTGQCTFDGVAKGGDFVVVLS